MGLGLGTMASRRVAKALAVPLAPGTNDICVSAPSDSTSLRGEHHKKKDKYLMSIIQESWMRNVSTSLLGEHHKRKNKQDNNTRITDKKCQHPACRELGNLDATWAQQGRCPHSTKSTRPANRCPIKCKGMNFLACGSWNDLHQLTHCNAKPHPLGSSSGTVQQ